MFNLENLVFIHIYSTYILNIFFLFRLHEKIAKHILKSIVDNMFIKYLRMLYNISTFWLLYTYYITYFLWIKITLF